jgi:hypothetical protein
VPQFMVQDAPTFSALQGPQYDMGHHWQKVAP